MTGIPLADTMTPASRVVQTPTTGRVIFQVVLTSLGAFLWAIALLLVRADGLPPDSAGVVNALPPVFWAALAILTLAAASTWQSSRRLDRLAAIQLALLVGGLWLIPLLAGNTLTGTRYTFGYHTLSDYIIRFGRLDPVSQWYHNWPGFNLVDSFLFQLIGAERADALLIWAVVPMQAALAFGLVALFRSILPGNYWAMATWFYFLFNWTGQTYYSPQGFANILLVALMCSWVWYLKGQPEQRRHAPALLSVMLVAGLTLSHMLTAIVAAAMLTVSETVGSRRFPRVGVLAALLTTAWLLYLASRYFNSQVPLFVERALRFADLWFWNIGRAQSLGNPAHIAVVNVRIWYSILAGLLGLWGVIVARRHTIASDMTMMAMGAGGILLLPVQIYQNELFSRLFLYACPLIAYFCAKLGRELVPRVIVTAVLLAALPFGVISLHGNQLVDDVSIGQRAYWRFLEEKTNSGHLELGGIPMAWTFGQADKYVSGFDLVAGYGREWEERLSKRGWVEPGMPNYLGFSDYEDAGFLLWSDFPGAKAELVKLADTRSFYQRIYSGGEVVAFYDDLRDLGVADLR